MKKVSTETKGSDSMKYSTVDIMKQKQNKEWESDKTMDIIFLKWIEQSKPFMKNY